ncbi:MAG: cold-shock protein [Roseateles sp.]
MRFQGVLTAWDPDAGYGSIRPLGGGEDLFVALTAFPTDGEGARLDEALSFEIVTGRDGRKQAVNLRRLPAVQLAPALREASGAARIRLRQAQKRRRMGLAAGVVVAIVLALGSARLWQPDAAGVQVLAGVRR